MVPKVFIAILHELLWKCRGEFLYKTEIKVLHTRSLNVRRFYKQHCCILGRGEPSRPLSLMPMGGGAHLRNCTPPRWSFWGTAHLPEPARRGSLQGTTHLLGDLLGDFTHPSEPCCKGSASEELHTSRADRWGTVPIPVPCFQIDTNVHKIG